MAKLATLVLSDGKPGHYHLSDGICAALARRRELDITKVSIARPWWLPGRMLSSLTNAPGQLPAAVPSVFGFDRQPLPRCDLIVSAGGDTLAANVWLARRYGCPNIFYGSLRRYQPADFSLVLTSYAANADRPNHAMTLKPSAFDPDSLPRRPMGPFEPRVVGLLVGGDSGTVGFQPGDWVRLLGLLAKPGSVQRRWIVSNSRRTPARVSDRLGAMAAASSGWIEFIDVRRAGAGSLTQLFADADTIAVTVDSSSMISEAIWARKPVVALLPTSSRLPDLEQSYRDYLVAQGWLATLPLAGATSEAVRNQLACVTPLTGNPLDTLATLLQARLPTVAT